MNLKQKILFSIAMSVIFFMFLLIIFDDNGLADLNVLKIKKESLVIKNKELTRENLFLCRKIDRLKYDAKFIENVARQELGMIGKDEVIFKLKKLEN